MTDQTVKTSGTQKAYKSNSEPLRQSTIRTAPPSNQLHTNISLPGRKMYKSYEEENRLENVRRSLF